MVMTTEVLRNMLLQTPSELWGVGCIIFDEIHYLADPERGTTWEESIIMCPHDIQLVCLSATVTNAPEIADWISRTHRPDPPGHATSSAPCPSRSTTSSTASCTWSINAKGQQVADFNVGGEIRKQACAAGATWARRSRRRRPARVSAPSRRRAKSSRPWSAQTCCPPSTSCSRRRDCEAAAEVCAMMRLRAVHDPDTRRASTPSSRSYLERLDPGGPHAGAGAAWSSTWRGAASASTTPACCQS